MLPSRPAALLVAAVLVLSGCAAGGHPTAEPPSRSPSPTPTERTTVLPVDCTKVISADRYATELAPTPLNDPAYLAPDRANAVKPVAPPPGAGFAEQLADAVELRCIWRAPGTDAPSMTLTEAHVPMDAATSYLSRAKLLHYNCADTHGGRECQKAQQRRGVAVLHTVFLRDDVFIDVTQSDFITNDIVGSIVATLWP